jgi:hypothetical protein
MSATVSYDPYYSDGYLLEAAAALANAPGPRPEGRRLHAGVVVAVYTALSAEAHINYAIFSAFDSNNERKRLLNMELRSKLQYVPQLATGKAVFDPGHAPLGDLFALVETRNKLVHARPPKWEFDGKGAGMTISFDPTGFPLGRAAQYLSSLCHYLDDLERADPGTWKEQAWLARELLAQDAALRSWETDRDGPPLRLLVEHLTDHLPDE